MWVVPYIPARTQGALPNRLWMAVVWWSAQHRMLELSPSVGSDTATAVGWIINIKENKIFIIIIGVDGRKCSSPPHASAASYP